MHSILLPVTTRTARYAIRIVLGMFARGCTLLKEASIATWRSRASGVDAIPAIITCNEITSL